MYHSIPLDCLPKITVEDLRDDHSGKYNVASYLAPYYLFISVYPVWLLTNELVRYQPPSGLD